jgi:DNA-binding MarR family transcriptional regulator/L-amino acid N-acyltransferase YncA
MQQMGLQEKVAAMRRFTRFFGQRLGTLDAGPAGSPYSATEVRVLSELALERQRTVSALSRSLGLDAGYLSRVLRRLETTGVVARAAAGADQRQQPMTLTAQGQAEMATIEAITQSRYAALVRTLPAHTHAPILNAMERIEVAFGADIPGRDPTPYVLRPARAGETSFVTQRTIASMLEEFDFAASLEVEVMEWVSGFMSRFNAATDCTWVAEREGVVVGSVFVADRGVREGVRDAEVAWLHVESGARGVGIGRRLLAEAVTFAKASGAGRLRGELRDEMKTGRRVAWGVGFRMVDEDRSGTEFRGGRSSWAVVLGGSE